MANYYTLHVFDSDLFHKKVVPKIRNDLDYINSYLDSDVYKLFTIRDMEENLNPQKFQEFFKTLSKDCKTYSGNMQTIPFSYFKLIEIIIFTECAIFSPYFNLGYRAMFKSIRFTQNLTIAEELLSSFISGIDDNIFTYDSFGVVNWVTSEEVELLFSELDKIVPKEEGETFCKELKSFIQEANQNNLGLISCIDPQYDFHCYVNNKADHLQRFKKRNAFTFFVDVDCSKMPKKLNFENRT